MLNTFISIAEVIVQCTAVSRGSASIFGGRFITGKPDQQIIEIDR